MGKFDKDRFQKELAVRYCLARGITPFLEVIVPSSSDLSHAIEVLTDIDVLGVELSGDGCLRRTIFDCKTGKMSGINRAFWAAGVKDYMDCDEAVVILKSRAPDNHRISALTINVDLHDEVSFRDLGKTYDQAFDQDRFYLSSIDRWNAVYEAYSRNEWSSQIFSLVRNIAPVSTQPASTFRRLIGEVRSRRGSVDPVKDAHMGIFWDILSACFINWSAMGRDVRRFYQPNIKKEEFESLLRFYIWGGKEAFQIRQELMPKNEDGSIRLLELPGWEKIFSFASIIISAPQDIYGCVDICQSLSIRAVCGSDIAHDSQVKRSFDLNRRARQFIMAMSELIVSSCSLPKDVLDITKRTISQF